VTNRTNLITFFGGFHGRTYGAISICGESKLRKNISPLVPGIIHVPYAYCYRCYFGKTYPDCDLFCLEAIKEIFDTVSSPEEIAMVITEPIQAVGGVLVPPQGYISGLRRLCDENNILLGVDEVYTGFGRTGKLFAVEHENVTPDIMTVAKSIAAGMPLSGVIARREIMGKWPPGAHGSTFGGCPVSCAAAIEVLNVIDEQKLVERSAKIGAYLIKRLRDMQDEMPIIGDVRGKGMLIGVELIKEPKNKVPAATETKKILVDAFKKGLLLSTGGLHDNVLRISPPLILTREEAEKGIDVLRDALKHCVSAA
jgi:4-aminobutyrate aminotransferase